MALVPEVDIFMAEQRKINTSPVVKSLANLDQEIRAILEDTAMPPDRKIQLYDILNQYRPKIPYVRVLKTLKRKKRKRAKQPAFTTPTGTVVLPTPVPAEEEEEEEILLLLATPTAETPLQLSQPLRPRPLNHPNMEKR